MSSQVKTSIGSHEQLLLRYNAVEGRGKKRVVQGLLIVMAMQLWHFSCPFRPRISLLCQLACFVIDWWDCLYENFIQGRDSQCLPGQPHSASVHRRPAALIKISRRPGQHTIRILSGLSSDRPEKLIQHVAAVGGLLLAAWIGLPPCHISIVDRQQELKSVLKTF